MTQFLTPLGADALRAEGIPEPWTFGMADRVRFGELDVLGHVNNAAYLRWFENLRIQYFEAYGLFDYSKTPPKLVLRNIALGFRKEVKLHDTYVLTGRTVEVRTNSFSMTYGVWVNGELTTTGEAVLVSLNDDNTKRPLSDQTRQNFIEQDGATQV